MSNDPLALDQAIPALLDDLLARFEAHVPVSDEFPDLTAKRRVRHDSSWNATHADVFLELSVRAMNPRAHPGFDHLRFLAMRARCPRTQGFVSTTLLHGPKEALRRQLEALRAQPAELVAMAAALLEGLPVETDPDLWR